MTLHIKKKSSWTDEFTADGLKGTDYEPGDVVVAPDLQMRLGEETVAVFSFGEDEFLYNRGLFHTYEDAEMFAELIHEEGDEDE